MVKKKEKIRETETIIRSSTLERLPVGNDEEGKDKAGSARAMHKATE